MLGAIAGDVIGSVYERRPVKTKDFPLFPAGSRFTDDSVLTVAVARAILTDGDYRRALWRTGRDYPDAGYGGTFIRWLASPDPQPYGSWGNGAAMRVSPVGFAFDTVAEVLEQAERSAAVSHDHSEGIKGAQATALAVFRHALEGALMRLALAVFRARTGAGRDAIRDEVEGRFGYDLERRLDEIRPGYDFDVSCQGSVPEALIAFLESDGYEDAVRNAVSLGGDADTLGAIVGGVAEAFYGGVPEGILAEVRDRLTPDLWSTCEAFRRRYPLRRPVAQ